jgi:hypothetical protein
MGWDLLIHSVVFQTGAKQKTLSKWSKLLEFPSNVLVYSL